MKSKIGYNLGLLGSILVILWQVLWFVPIMGMPLAFQSLHYFALAIFPVIMGILGVIGGRVGKGGKRNVGVLLLLVAGIGGVIIYFIPFLNFLSVSHPFTLVGGVLLLLGGILVLVSKDMEEKQVKPIT